MSAADIIDFAALNLKVDDIAGRAKRSLERFQYLYENYAIYDRVKSGQMIAAPLGDIYTALNGRDYLDAIAGITNRQIDFCDIQATC